MAQVAQMEGHGNGNGNGGHPPNDQDGWSRVDHVMDGGAPSGMSGQPVDENFVRARTLAYHYCCHVSWQPRAAPSVTTSAGVVQWAEIGVWFSEDGTGQGQNGTMPPMGGGCVPGSSCTLPPPTPPPATT
jgi:hypothetical protein